MTAAIQSSLSKLTQSLQNLENSVAEAQDNKKAVKPKASPNDLFSVSRSNDVDAKALASRLDGAIAKVEKLLREG